MPESPAYAIVGKGRWAARMHTILSNEHRHIIPIDATRRLPAESETEYKSRLCAALKTTGAQIAWLCVPPGSHIPPLVKAAIEAGLHIVAEKPWLCSHSETAELQRLANARHLLIAVHYEYCLLTEVEAWRNQYGDDSGLRFGGCFHHSRSDHSGLSALDNLGTHLLSIWEYAVPQFSVSEIRCAYERPDQREVWLEKDGQRVASIDLLTHGQPIIQRFAKAVETALDGAAFSFGLNFALRVADATAALK